MKIQSFFYPLTFIVGVIFALGMIGCNTDTSSSILFSREDFTVGQREVVYTHAQRNSRNLVWWPDGNMGVINEGNGTYVFYAANSIQTVMTVGTLDEPAKYSSKDIRILNPKENSDYMSGGHIYLLDENTLLLFYHAEQYRDGYYRNFASMTGAAVSTTKDENGRFIDFVDLGLIISSNRPFSNTSNRAMDMLGTASVLYNGYIYFYFRDYIDGVAWTINNLTVARASISDIRTAVNNGTAPVFLKYYNGGFSEPGLGGRSSPLENGNPGSSWLDISYNSYINKFIIAAIQWQSPTDQYLYITVSDDGINWSRRFLISDEAGEHFFSTIIGIGDDPQVTGKEFYIYYTHSISGAWDRWSDAQLLRRKITLN